MSRDSPLLRELLENMDIRDHAPIEEGQEKGTSYEDLVTIDYAALARDSEATADIDQMEWPKFDSWNTWGDWMDAKDGLTSTVVPKEVQEELELFFESWSPDPSPDTSEITENDNDVNGTQDSLLLEDDGFLFNVDDPLEGQITPPERPSTPTPPVLKPQRLTYNEDTVSLPNIAELVESDREEQKTESHPSMSRTAEVLLSSSADELPSMSTSTERGRKRKTKESDYQRSVKMTKMAYSSSDDDWEERDQMLRRRHD